MSFERLQKMSGLLSERTDSTREDGHDRRRARLADLTGFIQAQLANPLPLSEELQQASRGSWLAFKRALE